MILKVAAQNNVPAQPPQPLPNVLRLIQRESGDVDLAVVDEKTGAVVDAGYLLRIGCDGLIHRERYVNSTLGFSLDGSERVRMESE